MNVWDILILLLVAAGALLAARHMRKTKGTGCGGCCAACAHQCDRRGN